MEKFAISFTEQEVAQLMTALKFAAEKHRNQRRKDAEASPYINHPIDVAELLWRVGEVRDMNVLLAALLHDTIEDTGTQPDEIQTRFGAIVLALVQEVSDDKRLPKEERKRLQVKNAPHKSFHAKRIKMADKICNVRDITHSPPTGWTWTRRDEYLTWTEQVFAGLRGANAALEALYDETLRAGRARLSGEKPD